MGSLARFTGLLAFATALGAIAVGYAAVMPLLDAQPQLVDPNLARAISEPIAIRLANIVVASCTVLAATVGLWARSRIATTISLLLLAAAAANRALVVPAAYAAWSRVDLVALKPAARLAEAQALARDHQLLLTGMTLALLAVAWLATRSNAAAPAQTLADETPAAPVASPQVA